MQSKLIEALHLAKEVLDICGGDAWERECSFEARNKFNAIYDELFPTNKNTNSLQLNESCEICRITMPKGNLQSHLNGKKHKKRILNEEQKRRSLYAKF